MQLTKLIYLENFTLLNTQAKVVGVLEQEGRVVVILDQTVFYPQGGGQPFDQGHISSDDALFFVEDVRFIDGLVYHYGHFDHGKFTDGQTVSCEVDPIRRGLHSRLHSAGHVIDMVLKRLEINWVPGKGYHFPQGPYVEYIGELGEVDREELKLKIENVCNDIISEDVKTKLEFISPVQAEDRGFEVPGNIVESGKPIRIVFYGDFGILCGGTHVSHLSEIGEMTIRKIKPEGKNIRVGYDVK
jgi:alanyl-tRNA synthetase